MATYSSLGDGTDGAPATPDGLTLARLPAVAAPGPATRAGAAGVTTGLTSRAAGDDAAAVDGAPAAPPAGRPRTLNNVWPWPSHVYRASWLWPWRRFYLAFIYGCLVMMLAIGTTANLCIQILFHIVYRVVPESPEPAEGQAGGAVGLLFLTVLVIGLVFGTLALALFMTTVWTLAWSSFHGRELLGPGLLPALFRSCCRRGRTGTADAASVSPSRPVVMFLQAVQIVSVELLPACLGVRTTLLDRSLRAGVAAWLKVATLSATAIAVLFTLAKFFYYLALFCSDLRYVRRMNPSAGNKTLRTVEDEVRGAIESDAGALPASCTTANMNFAEKHRLHLCFEFCKPRCCPVTVPWLAKLACIWGFAALVGWVSSAFMAPDVSTGQPDSTTQLIAGVVVGLAVALGLTALFVRASTNDLYGCCTNRDAPLWPLRRGHRRCFGEPAKDYTTTFKGLLVVGLIALAIAILLVTLHASAPAAVAVLFILAAVFLALSCLVPLQPWYSTLTTLGLLAATLTLVNIFTWVFCAGAGCWYGPTLGTALAAVLLCLSLWRLNNMFTDDKVFADATEPAVGAVAAVERLKKSLAKEARTGRAFVAFGYAVVAVFVLAAVFIVFGSTVFDSPKVLYQRAATSSGPIPASSPYPVCHSSWFGLTVVDTALLAQLAYDYPSTDAVEGNFEADLAAWFGGRFQLAAAHVGTTDAHFYVLNSTSPQADLAIITVRGSVEHRDWIKDADLWSEASVVQAVASLTPAGALMPHEVVDVWLTVMGWTDLFLQAATGASPVVLDYVTPAETALLDAFGGRYPSQILVIGHSLGGGIAKLVGASLVEAASGSDVQVVSFSGPGLSYTSISTTIVPDFDIVPRIDVQLGEEAHIDCHASLFVDCHFIYRTASDLIGRCGDPHGRGVKCSAESTCNQTSCCD